MKFKDRDRCHVCHRRAERAALRRACVQCGRSRHLQDDGRCAGCRRAAAPRKPPKTITCRHCGQQRRNAGHGLCNRCSLADPGRPFRYAASLAKRLPSPPPWWNLLVEFAAARHHPSGTMAVLRETGRALTANPATTPHQLRRAAGAPISPTTERVLTAFFTSQGLILARSDTRERAALARQRYLDAVPAPLGQAVAQFNDVQVSEQDRRTRTGRRTLSDITLATRLRILRDLAADIGANRPVTGWAEVTTADLERFLARSPAARHQQTYVLRRFFAWAKGRRLVLANPARALALGAQPAFTGIVLDLATQRALFRRWTTDTTPARERLVGLLALLHAATNAQIRTLTLAEVDHARQALTLHGRPAPAPMDPATWAAIQACRREREATGTLNPHLIVSRVTQSRATPVHQTYLARLLAPAGTSPALCRQTRLTQLVTDLDPKLTATVLGMHDTGLVRYLADNVDRDRLRPTAPGR
ncbi:integrase [Georgenia muralis]|uniref:Core-binding (CB) domain-containing protein n=1 Tax=Georgenia muralis TaxID=154117 RepID=A0A3N4Z2E9_9MICO|nr:integrase [Georgenia muralis]RPF26004.1 hypothetical protein EDD32_0421 [Georgenia muralis]RPF27277.1 hypothetical protein EDD32_1750 [Georgenia muralis]